jgi:hypothetical protein
MMSAFFNEVFINASEQNFLTACAAGAVSFDGKRDAKPPAGSAGGAAQQNRTYISSTCSPALSPTRGMGQKLADREQAVLRGKNIAKRQAGIIRSILFIF